MNVWIALSIAFGIVFVGSLIVGANTRQPYDEVGILLAVAAALLLLGFLAPGIITANNDEAAACAAKGGHIIGTGRASFCVSSDGRILE